MRIDTKTVVAEYCGMDRADVADYEYQHGRFPVRVYAIGAQYLCVTTGGKRPPQDVRGGPAIDWQAAPRSTWPMPRYPTATLWFAVSA